MACSPDTRNSAGRYECLRKHHTLLLLLLLLRRAVLLSLPFCFSRAVIIDFSLLLLSSYSLAST